MVRYRELLIDHSGHLLLELFCHIYTWWDKLFKTAFRAILWCCLHIRSMIKNIKGATHKIGDIDGTCKQAFTQCNNSKTLVYIQLLMVSLHVAFLVHFIQTARYWFALSQWWWTKLRAERVDKMYCNLSFQTKSIWMGGSYRSRLE